MSATAQAPSNVDGGAVAARTATTAIGLAGAERDFTVNVATARDVDGTGTNAGASS